MSESGVLDVGEDRREDARKRADEVIGDAKRPAGEADRTVETVVEMGDPAPRPSSISSRHTTSITSSWADTAAIATNSRAGSSGRWRPE